MFIIPLCRIKESQLFCCHSPYSFSNNNNQKTRHNYHRTLQHIWPKNSIIKAATDNYISFVECRLNKRHTQYRREIQSTNDAHARFGVESNVKRHGKITLENGRSAFRFWLNGGDDKWRRGGCFSTMRPCGIPIEGGAAHADVVGEEAPPRNALLPLN